MNSNVKNRKADKRGGQADSLETMAVFDNRNQSLEPWEISVPSAVEKCTAGLMAKQKTSMRMYCRPLSRSAIVLETCMTLDGEESFMCTIGDYSFSLGGSKSPGAKITLDRWPIAVTGKCRLASGEHRIRCARMDGAVLLSLDGELVLETKDPRDSEPIFSLEYFIPESITVREVIVKGKSAALKGIPLRKSRSYNLHMCMDFFDDLLPAPWTERTLRETMGIYSRYNIKRLYFIDHGGFQSGFWDHYHDSAGHRLEGNVRRTFENLGDILPAVTAAGHNEGIEVYGLFKPQECGMALTYPFGSEEARKFGKVPRLDGAMWWATDFVAKHPEMRLERDMRPVPQDLDKRIVGRIVLSAEKGLKAAFDPRRIRLLVSNDNGAYAPYAGPMEIRVEGKEKIILDRLSIKEKFMALTVQGEATRTFGNTLRNLIEAYDLEGRKLPLSYASLTHPRNLPPEQGSFVYDYPVDTVGEMDNYFWLDSGRTLGIAKGWERYICGVLCEAYPEVRDWWMELIEYYIKSGVDGVDIRDQVHSRTFDWDVFGFNKPLVEAFREKHGVDILNEPFRREDLRRLRGEYYTGFLRRAHQRLKASGKKTHLHVSSRMKSPDWHTELDLYQDLEGWLREGLVDELTMKMSFLTGEVAAKSLETARELGLPVNYCPFMNGVPGQSNAKAIVNSLVRQALDNGADGYIIYENAVFLEAQKNGGVNIRHPWILDAIKQYARD